jgi:hypothetical protein
VSITVLLPGTNKASTKVRHTPSCRVTIFIVVLGQVTVLPDGHVVVETPKPGTPNVKYLLDLQLFGRLRVGVLFHMLKKWTKS